MKKLVLLYFLSCFTQHLLGDYQAWKSAFEQKFSDVSFTVKVESLLTTLRLTVEKRDENSQEFLYFYNYLRELHNWKPAHSIADIDTWWIDEVEKAYRDEIIHDDAAQTPAQDLLETQEILDPEHEQEEENIENDEEPSEDELENLSKQRIGLLLQIIKIQMLMEQIGVSNQENQKSLLQAYNDLREALDQNRAHSIEEIDTLWIDDVETAYGDDAVEPYQKDSIESAQEQKNLSHEVYHLLRRLKVELSKKSDLPPDRLAENRALDLYNHVRTLLNRDNARSKAEIDTSWIEEVKTACLRCYYIDTISDDSDLPLPGHNKLAQKTFKMLNLKKMHILSSLHEDGAFNSQGLERNFDLTVSSYVGLPRTPDINIRTASLYHELAHAYYNDTESIRAIIKEQQKSDAAPDKKDILIQLVQHYLDESELKDAVEKIQHYLQSGKTAFTNSTPLGRHINDVLSKHATFWIPPKDQFLYYNVLLQRRHEQRADLYALENLYAHQKIDAIFQSIADYLNDRNIVINDDAKVHPSGFERALYMAGFLVSRGINVEEALRTWTVQGSCQLPYSTLSTEWPDEDPLTVGAHDFIVEWKKNRVSPESRWKESMIEDWEIEKLSITDRILQLSLYILDTLDSDSINKRTDFHYAYNLLRELCGLTGEETVDSRWVQEIDYQYWKKEHAENKDRKSLISSLVLNIHNVYQKANTFVLKRHLLYSYNFLSELVGKNTIDSIDKIEENWIEIIDKATDFGLKNFLGSVNQI